MPSDKDRALDITSIEIFLAIVEMQSLSRAAEKLYLSQPALSNRLNALEQELGGTLVNRSQGVKQISLTPRGEEFIQFARRYESLVKDIDLWKKNEPKYLFRFASPSSLNAYLLPPLFHSLIDNGHALTLKITSHWNETVYSMMEAYDLDMGMVTRRFTSGHVVSTPVMTERMVMLSDPESSDYGDHVHPRALAVVDEVHLDWGANYQTWHDLWWSPADRMNYFIDTPALIKRFLGRKNAWAMVPMSIANTLRQEGPLRISECLEPIPDRVIYKLSHRTPKPGSREALAIFEKELSDFIDTNIALGTIGFPALPG